MPGCGWLVGFGLLDLNYVTEIYMVDMCLTGFCMDFTYVVVQKYQDCSLLNTFFRTEGTNINLNLCSFIHSSISDGHLLFSATRLHFNVLFI